MLTSFFVSNNIGNNMPIKKKVCCGTLWIFCHLNQIRYKYYQLALPIKRFQLWKLNSISKFIQCKPDLRELFKLNIYDHK